MQSNSRYSGRQGSQFPQLKPGGVLISLAHVGAGIFQAWEEVVWNENNKANKRSIETLLILGLIRLNKDLPLHRSQV
jgi:disulfide bond formation protein DsbB